MGENERINDTRIINVDTARINARRVLESRRAQESFEPIISMVDLEISRASKNGQYEVKVPLNQDQKVLIKKLEEKLIYEGWTVNTDDANGVITISWNEI